LNLDNVGVFERIYIVLNLLGAHIENILTNSEARKDFFSDARVWVIISAIVVLVFVFEFSKRYLMRKSMVHPPIPKNDDKKEKNSGSHVDGSK
jgi:hypothetical protein